MKKHNIFLSLVSKQVFLFILALLCQNQLCYSQEKNDFESSSSITYVGQIPSENLKNKSSFFEKITKLVLGENKIDLIKPISCYALDTNSLLILDQGIMNIINYHDKQIDIPNYYKKHTYTSLVGMCALTGNQYLFTNSSDSNLNILNTEEKKLSVFNESLILKQPTGIAYSKTTNEIWVVETKAHQISILNKNGERIKSIGKRGIGEGEFNFPTFIWIDAKGNVYVIDSMNFRLQIFDKEGNFVSMFGEAGDATGYFARPKGVATDSEGNIYIVDALFHTVQIFNKKGEFLYNFGSQGQKQGEFWMPSGIFIDENDFVYVADSYNSRIQIFTLSRGDENEK